MMKEEPIMLSVILSMSDSPDDKRKIERLYELYNRLMYTIAYRILNNHEDAEDAIILSWEKIILNLDKIHKIDCQETKSLFVIITERASIDLYRKESRRRQHHFLSDNMEEHPYITTGDIDIEKIHLYDIMRNIPKKYAEVLILYYVNGFTVREIAELLGENESAINKRMSRGRKMLKEEYDKA